MNKNRITITYTSFFVLLFFLPLFAFSERISDTVPNMHSFIHRIEANLRPDYIFPTNSFFKGENDKLQPIEKAFSTHLSYSFRFHPDTYAARIYGNPYQGIGYAQYLFQNHHEIGKPITIYLLQGARILRISSGLALDYEWNFGLSSGWNTYDETSNPHNKAIGSKTNAYINAGIYLHWQPSRKIDFISGLNLTHFSNGNTSIPNAGLNTIGLRAGFTYNFYTTPPVRMDKPSPPPIFPSHISYDLTIFGSWRRKGLLIHDHNPVISPEKYSVLGFNFAPMYNFGYKFRSGISLDGIYDASSNVYIEDEPTQCEKSEQYTFSKPPLIQQLGLGLSIRAEYVMPYFIIGLGMGINILQWAEDLQGFYQIASIKIEITRNSFLHIGYSLQNFKTPNHLMLGIGYRFNNKYPIYK